ncbi:MAG: hypothetical protein ACYC2U_08210 [Candidatus Amoebophilus sp.]
MRHIIHYIKNYTNYLLLGICISIIHGCNNNLSIEELDKKLADLELEKTVIKRIIEDKKQIEELLEETDYKKVGKALYLALRGEYQDYIKLFVEDSNYDLHTHSEVGGYALYLAAQDKKDFKGVYKRFREVVKNSDERANCLAISWLEAIQREDSKPIQIKYNSKHRDTFILPALLKKLAKNIRDELSQKHFEFLASHIEIPDSLLDEMRKDLGIALAAIEEGLAKNKEEKVAWESKQKIVQNFLEKIINYQNDKKSLSFAISISTDRPKLTVKPIYVPSNLFVHKEGDYSDSEEEGAPHFNGIYNLTKHGVYDIENTEEYYSPLVHPDSNTVVNNYVSDSEEVDTIKLEKDAKRIWKACKNRKHVTVLCAALRRKDNQIKKFVFTNLPSVYQFRINDKKNKKKLVSTKQNIEIIAKEAHSKGYHVIMAQQSHAEGELVQFLQERPTRYIDIVSMGCSRTHCLICKDLLEHRIGKGKLKKISTSGETDHKFKMWLIPQALSNFCESNSYKPDLTKQVVCNNEETMRKYWRDMNGSEDPGDEIKQKKHQRLTLDEWENRPWKRKSSKEGGEKAGKKKEKDLSDSRAQHPKISQDAEVELFKIRSRSLCDFTEQIRNLQMEYMLGNIDVEIIDLRDNGLDMYLDEDELVSIIRLIGISKIDLRDNDIGVKWAIKFAKCLPGGCEINMRNNDITEEEGENLRFLYPHISWHF